MARDASEIWPEDKALPSPPVRSVFLDTGEEVAEYTGSDFGNQSEDWDKRNLIGAGLIIRGVSSETFHEDGSTYPPARSVLYNVVHLKMGDVEYADDAGIDPWGMFFTDQTEEPHDWGTAREAKGTSTLLKQVRTEFKKNGGRPFLATIEWVVTVPAKGNAAEQGYYKLAKWTRKVSDA